MPVAYTVGSGSRGRSYLINIDGRIFVSPISWYTGPHQWDWSPGYAVDNNFRFDRKISEGCISCHAGLVAVHPQDHDRFAEPPVIEASIGCERCHGPGRDHIAYQSGEAPADARDPIVNPEKLAGARRDAVCNQCHLAGKRRVVRLGKSEFAFQPGMFLSDNWVIFLKTEGIDTGVAAAVSQAEQMFASECYRKSNGALGCITCHESHSTPHAESPEAVFRQKCLNCHGRQAPECSEPLARRQEITTTDSCMDCHMGKFPASDVHAAQTNHRIARHKPAITVGSRKSRIPDEHPVLFIEPGAPTDQKDWDRARGIYLGERTASASNAKTAVELLKHLEQEPAADVEGLYILGQAAESVNQPNRAVRVWEKLLKLEPRHERALESLAIHFHETRNLDLARQYYERLIEVNPGKSQYYGRLAHVLGQAGDLPAAIQVAEKCLELNPSLPQTHGWLVEAYRGIGDDERAAYHQAKVKAFQSVQKRPP
jgi:Flp pilus assembly protein TadD